MSNMSPHHKTNQSFQKASPKILPVILACSIAISNVAPVFAGVGDVNSTNTTMNPNTGTYYNTAGNQTSFINDKGIIFQNGTYRFLESDAARNLTGNGGNAYIQAPYVGMNRATLDASGVRDGSGAFIGNGGNIRVNARMFYGTDSDIIVAGKAGGSAVFSVGSMFSRGMKIDARGTDGVGGQIRVDAQNIVDLDKNTLFDASGKVVGNFDNSLIDIKGAVVNSEGILKANGIGSQGGHINLTAAGNPDDCIGCDADAATRLGIITQAQANDVKVTFDSLKTQGGSVLLGSNSAISADGASNVAVTMDTGREYNYARVGGGGHVVINAQNNIVNKGSISARGGEGKKEGIMLNGGHGGSVSMLAGNNVSNQGLVDVSGGHGLNSHFTLTSGNKSFEYDAGGYGGDGGVIVTSGKQISNSGQMLAKGGKAGDGSSAYAEVVDSQINVAGNAVADVYAARGSNGGNGGLIVFNSKVNPINSGLIDASGGNGGNGGNASAYATARSVYGDAYANARAIAGDAGQGGHGGTIVVASPTSFTSTGSGSIQLNAAASGIAGTGYAESNSYGYNYSTSQAYAKGNNNTHAKAYGNSIYTPVAIASKDIYAAKAPGANGVIDVLRPTEAIVHNGNTILLNSSGVTGTLSGLVGTANVRSTAAQLGGAVIPVGTKQLVVGDVSGNALEINPGAISTSFAGVNKVTISTQHDLLNRDSIVTQDVSAIAGRDISNQAHIVTAQSVLLGAGRNLTNNGLITSATKHVGGSILISAPGVITNNSEISAGSHNYGGAIHIRGGQLMNTATGRIAANSYYNYNNGGQPGYVPPANAPNSNAGFINIIADSVKNQGHITTDQVDNAGKGGINFIIAKDRFENSGTVSSNGKDAGCVVIGVRSAQPGQLLNTGSIVANGTQTPGKVVLADGATAVRRLICLDPPPPPPPPANPPGVDTGVFLPGNQPPDTTAVVGVPPTVEVADANLFLARGFEGMTQQILDQAFVTYQSALERGNDELNANQQAIEYLMQAGMTCCVAGELAKRIEAGTMTLNTNAENQKIHDVLSVISQTCLPEDGGQTLIQ